MTFNDIEKKPYETVLEKMIVSSIFSFSHNVFDPWKISPFLLSALPILQFSFWVLFILLSAKSFNLNLSKILSFGEVFIGCMQMLSV